MNVAHPRGSVFDPRTLSMTTFTGHGSRMSASVSPTTAPSANASGFQCGRRRSATRRRADAGFGAGAVDGRVVPSTFDLVLTRADTSGTTSSNQTFGDLSRLIAGAGCETWETEDYSPAAAQLSAPASRSEAISLALRPDSSSTASVCSPSSGARRRGLVGVPLNFNGDPSAFIAPSTGWSTSTTI